LFNFYKLILFHLSDKPLLGSRKNSQKSLHYGKLFTQLLK